MNELAQKLMNLDGRNSGQPQVATAIFGTAGQLASSLETRPPVRIGFWPVISSDAPEVAMGLASVLALLLEDMQGVLVYRLFARLETETPPADYSWTIENSQFDVDDWQLDALDENAALWGTLRRDDDLWILELSLENDLAEDETAEVKFIRQTSDLIQLVNALPDLAQEIADKLEITGTVEHPYEGLSADDSAVKALLAQLFDWQVKLLLRLWGHSWDIEQLQREFEALLTAGKAVEHEFGAWAVARVVAHAMQPGYDDIPEFLFSVVDNVVQAFPGSSTPSIYTAAALYRAGQVQEAFDLLEAAVESHPENVDTWLTLARLYQTSSRFQDALDAYQRAIEQDAVSATLYRRYAALLNALYTESFNVPAYTLIDPEDYDEDMPIWEAIEALEEALALEPDHLPTLQRQIQLVLDIQVENATLWDAFRKLVEFDQEGDTVREIIDAMFNVEDLDPAIDILQTELIKQPERHDLHINLANVYLQLDEPDLASDELEKAQALTDDPVIKADIERLMLSADDPEFESRLADISSLVSAGHKARAEDADFLEEAIEKSPSLVEGYVVLAKIYLSWEEHQDALDTLLDGYKQVPDDPEIVEMLAQVLWDSEELELAFDYLNKALAKNPNSVPLLALTGRYLVENGQVEDAKTFLARAEAISPRHPALAEAKAHIAQLVSRRDG